MTLTSQFPWLVLVGFAAQLVDGCVGMGCSSAILATLGIPPALSSATVHAAGVVTSGISGASHAWFKNLDRKIFFSLVIPGVLGAIIGASLLARVPTDIVKPVVWGYLLITSLVVLGRVILKRVPPGSQGHGPALGGIAGFLNAAGGGWGTIVTSTLIARGVPPRFAIGTANAADFFVALATSIALWIQLGQLRYDIMLALLIGGAVAAPASAWVTRQIPQRAAATVIGLIVFALGATGLFTTLT